MSIRRLVLTAAAMAAIAVVLAALTPPFPAMTASLAAAQRTVDTQGPDVLVSSAAGLLAWAVWAWGALGLALTAASALPGAAGGAARVVLHVALPAGARRSAALLLGLGLGVAPLAGAALPLLTPAVAVAAAGVPDWPTPARRAPTTPVPDWPAGASAASPTAGERTSSSAATVSGTSPRTRWSRSSAGRRTTARWPRPSAPGGSPTPTSSAPIPTSCCPARCCGGPARRERTPAPTRPRHRTSLESPMSAPARPVTDPAPERPPLRLVSSRRRSHPSRTSASRSGWSCPASPRPGRCTARGRAPAPCMQPSPPTTSARPGPPAPNCPTRGTPGGA